MVVEGHKLALIEAAEPPCTATLHTAHSIGVHGHIPVLVHGPFPPSCALPQFSSPTRFKPGSISLMASIAFAPTAAPEGKSICQIAVTYPQ